MHKVTRETEILYQARVEDKAVLAMMNFEQSDNPTALRPGRAAGGKKPYTLDRQYHEEHVVKKLVAIVVMLLVIGQLVWAMG